MTGSGTGATRNEFGNYIMNTVKDTTLESRWEEYVRSGSR